MPDTRPNILFIMSDDHASHAIGAYGSRINTTPHLDSRLPNVATHLQQGGYQTGIVGKWHLGQGARHWPAGFDFWSVLPGQGIYHDPVFYEMSERCVEPGYVTDVIMDKCLEWLQSRDRRRPFFLMCHHKAPHRPWDPKPEHRSLYLDKIAVPDSFDDDYRNRAGAAAAARMRIAEDMTYDDLDFVQLPESPGRTRGTGEHKMVPHPENPSTLELRCRNTGRLFSFESSDELKRFKYQRYMQKYLQCVHSIDENVGHLMDYLDQQGLTDDTVVIYTSDQGFYLGEHGWFAIPRLVEAGGRCGQMVSNVDFAPTFLELFNVFGDPDYAGVVQEMTDKLDAEMDRISDTPMHRRSR